MISVTEIYDDFVMDDANKDQNGDITYTKFNRWLWRAQLRLIDWLTGNFDGNPKPEQISTQKQRDLLSIFIKKYAVQVSNGSISKPDDYYLFRDLYRLEGVQVDCPDEYNEDELKVLKKPVELLDNSKFTTRCSTSIRRLKPAVKPIAKLSASNTFEFEPQDLGSVVLEYYRYPSKAAIVTMTDTTYNDVVPNPALSTNLEWPEDARSYILFFMSQFFAVHVREQGFQQQNAVAKP